MRLSLAVLALLALSVAAPAADPEMKAGSVLHLTSPAHGHPYSLYVPSNYTPRVSWPVVISSHGRGGSGKGEIGQWTGLAKKHGFIVACPDMCTATVNRPPTSGLAPAVEDEQVILSILEAIRGSFRVNPRAVMITGFSGGGNPSYHTGLRHPDLFTHICTRGGNFAIQQIPRDETLLAAGRDRLRIHIDYGENDHPLILGEDGNPGQAQQAYDALKKAGYEHVTIAKIPGMKHQSRPDIAADWFGAYLEENRKRFLAGDQVDDLIEKAREEIAKEKWRHAVRSLEKARKIEEKAELASRTAAVLAEVDAVGEKQVDAAKAARDAGDVKEALRILTRVTRDFRDLPSGDEAKDLREAWKE